MISKNANLQNQLLQWVLLIDQALELPCLSPSRLESIKTFCRTFVPPDVNEDDMIYYAQTLSTDEEFFLSLRRDISSCAEGTLVESIQGDQITRAVYTVLAPPGTLSETADLELVREVAYVSHDRGLHWTAEG